MRNQLKVVIIASAAIVAASCSRDMSTSPIASTESVAALAAAPISFDQLSTSFIGSSDDKDGFMPSGEHQGNGPNNGIGFGPGWGSFMGGGIGEGWIGGIGFGRGLGDGPFGAFDEDDSCAFSTTTNRLVCGPVTHGGLTVIRSFSFLDASGAVQQAFVRGTTNTVNVQRNVDGTRNHHETATSTVSSSSDLTVSGLATGSTQRTVDSKAAGTESTTGTKDGVAFTAVRVAGDTTAGLVIPIQDGSPTFPTAGTVIRQMQATITNAGGTPSMSSRREVVTYDGSSTAKVVITQDGVTKNCTKPLPHGKLTCQ
ncbi:MAG: hypothetical protein ABI408_10850 [Gemmatimonadaceae bacterium]